MFNLSSSRLGHVPNPNPNDGRFRKTGNGTPLPVKRLEFLKDISGSLRYIIASLPDGYPVKFFHQSIYLDTLNPVELLIDFDYQQSRHHLK